MTLEHWDTILRKYVLYLSASQHENDCGRFPFEKIPRRIFLDTNVINLLVKRSEEIFDHSPISPKCDSTLAIDTEALRHVFYVGARATWDIVASPKTLEELSRTSNPALREDLLAYGVEVLNFSFNSEDSRFALDFARRLVGSPFVAALPDRADQELVAHAIAFGCDTFCTCDRATILKNRDRLDQIPLRIVTPAEWWAHVRPWAALWC
jgi:predicted nucleic acid-binding protein